MLAKRQSRAAVMIFRLPKSLNFIPPANFTIYPSPDYSALYSTTILETENKYQSQFSLQVYYQLRNTRSCFS